MKIRLGNLFHYPVDVKKLNIPDYFDIIKVPMDFTTIKNKLNGNIYENINEYINDMMLVFWNCDTYNGIDSEVAKIG